MEHLRATTALPGHEQGEWDEPMCNYSANDSSSEDGYSGNGGFSHYLRDKRSSKVAQWILDHQDNFGRGALNVEDHSLVPWHTQERALDEGNGGRNDPESWDNERVPTCTAVDDRDSQQNWSDGHKRTLAECHVVEDMETDCYEEENAFIENRTWSEQQYEGPQTQNLSSKSVERCWRGETIRLCDSAAVPSGYQPGLPASNLVSMENDLRGEVPEVGSLSCPPSIDRHSLRTRSLLTSAPQSGSEDWHFVRVIPLQTHRDDLEDPRRPIAEYIGRKAAEELCLKKVLFKIAAQPDQRDHSQTEPAHASDYPHVKTVATTSTGINPEHHVLRDGQEPDNGTEDAHTRSTIPFLSPTHRPESPPCTEECRTTTAFLGNESQTTVESARAGSGDCNSRVPSGNAYENPPGDDDEFWALYQRPVNAEERPETHENTEKRVDNSCRNQEDSVPRMYTDVNGSEASAARRGIIQDLVSSGSRSESAASSETGLMRTAGAGCTRDPVIRLDTVEGVVLRDPRLKPHIFRGLSVCHFDLKPVRFETSAESPEPEFEYSSIETTKSCASQGTAERPAPVEARRSYTLPPIDLGEHVKVGSKGRRRDQELPNSRSQTKTPSTPVKRTPSRESTPYSLNSSSECKRRRYSEESRSSSVLSSPDSRSPPPPPPKRRVESQYGNEVQPIGSEPGRGMEQQLYVTPLYWQGHVAHPYVSWQASYWIPVMPQPSQYVQPAHPGFAYIPTYEQPAPISPAQPSPPGTSTVAVPPLFDAQQPLSALQQTDPMTQTQSQPLHQLQRTSQHFPAGFQPPVSNYPPAPAQPVFQFQQQQFPSAQPFASSPPLSPPAQFPGEPFLQPPGTSLEPLPQFENLPPPSNQGGPVKHTLYSSQASEGPPGAWYPPVPRPPAPPTPLRELPPPLKRRAPPLPDCPPPPLPPLPKSPPPPLPPTPLPPPPTLPTLPPPRQMSWAGTAQPMQLYQPPVSSTLEAAAPPEEVWSKHSQQAQDWSYQFDRQYYESSNASPGRDHWMVGDGEWYHQSTSFEDGQTENSTSAEYWEDE